MQIGMGVMFLACALLVHTRMANAKKYGESSVSWPSTDGQVIERELRHSASSGGSMNSGTPYHIIKYTYLVDGTQHTGKRIRFDKDAVSSAAAGNRQKGDVLNVYYDPQHPKSSILVTGYHGGQDDRTMLWFYIGFAAMGVMGCAGGIKGIVFGSFESDKLVKDSNRTR